MGNTAQLSLKRNGRLVNRKFTEFFFPSVLMSASISLSIIIDSAIVGNVLGSNELGAMNLIMPLSLCFTAISGMFGIGSATCISMFKGKMDSENANKSLMLSCIAWLVFSIAGVCLGLFANNAIAGFLSGSSGLENLVAQYLKVYLLGSPFTFIMLIFPHIIRADGKPKLSSNVLIIANAVNLCLDVVFMKFMNMGLAGGALATIVGYILGALLYIMYIKSNGRTLRPTKIKISDFRLYGDMFKMSVSSIFGQGLMFVKIWIFNMIVAREAGQAGLAAFSVCTSCLSFVSMFIAGAAQTMMPMVGSFYGADDNTAIEFTIKRALKIIIGCCVVITVLFEIFPEVILRFYGITDAAVMQTGIVAIRLFSIALTGIGFSFLFMYYAQARKMPSFSMQICALEGFVIIVPVCLLLSYIFGDKGIWISYTVNEILVVLFIFINAPPMSTTMLPVASFTGSPAPIAAAIGSSIRAAAFAPALITASSTARLSTSVIPDGIHTTTLGLKTLLTFASLIKERIIACVISKSAITPSFIGRTATMFSGVLPIISFAALPTASTLPSYLSIATTDGSLTTIPFPRTYTSVFAVPKSIPISFEKIPMSFSPFIKSPFQIHLPMSPPVRSREVPPR